MYETNPLILSICMHKKGSEKSKYSSGSPWNNTVTDDFSFQLCTFLIFKTSAMKRYYICNQKENTTWWALLLTSYHICRAILTFKKT